MATFKETLACDMGYAQYTITAEQQLPEDGDLLEVYVQLTLPDQNGVLLDELRFHDRVQIWGEKLSYNYSYRAQIAPVATWEQAVVLGREKCRAEIARLNAAIEARAKALSDAGLPEGD